MYIDPGHYVLRSAHRIKITTGSSLLTAVAGGTASFPSLSALGMIRQSGYTGQIHFKIGASASTSTPQWPSAGLFDMPMTKSLAESIRVISSSGDVYTTLLVFGPPSEG